jgi:pyruvate dehydrogenase E2 component (dihydrolipoamide acetyltransferase)
MAEFTMPSLGADMEAGVLVEWLKQPGDVVRRGDIIAEVETDKGIIEVEVFTDGVVDRLLVEPGTKVPVGTPLATIAEPGAEPKGPEAPQGETPPPAAPPPVAPKSETPPPAAPPPATPPVEAAPARLPWTGAADGPRPGTTLISDPRAASRIVGRLKISPSARLLARELGVDPRGLRGTGPGGAICRADVRRAASASTEERAPVEAPPGDDKERIRQAIAAAMARSKREIPHYYVSTTVDLTPLLDWIEQRNAELPVPERLIPAVVFVKAVAVALRTFPELNGRWEGRVVPSDGIHVGPAIALRGGGLVAPALHDTDRASLADLMRRFRDLVTRARRGSLRSSEMGGGTITVTNLGDRGTESVFGVIYPPQVAIVGFGRIVERPWVVDGAVVPRRVVTVTLSADHRVSDGHRGALFLEAIADLLQRPGDL